MSTQENPTPDPTPVATVPGPREPEREASETDSTTVDFVTFVMAGETYAFPMERVHEIIRMPEIVRLPLGGPALEGLANLRGRVLPVVSLRGCCGMPRVAQAEATRIIVVDAGTVLGFVVDRVAAVTSVDRARIVPAETVTVTLRSDLLAGVIQSESGELTSVLDVPALVAAEFSRIVHQLPEGDIHTPAGEASPARTGEDDSTDTLELVSFAVTAQEYALPIDRVQEIVQVPEHITAVPNSEHRMLGVMDLRGRLLPVFSLRRILGLADEALQPHNRIVVIGLDGQPGVAPLVVGVVMDTVREVLRVPRTLVDDLPAVAASGRAAPEVESVCRLEDGARLVSILAAERLFDASAHRAIEANSEIEGADDARTEQGDESMNQDDGRGDDELMVVFRLADEEYGVDVDAVQEIIRVPETLIRVPRSLEFVEGLVNLRGAVLPVVDLRTRLSLERVVRDERQRIVVLLINGTPSGFIVDSVTEVLRIGPGAIEPAPELSDEQARLISKVANLVSAERMLLILQPGQLLAAAEVDRLAEEDLLQELAESENDQVLVP